MGLNPRRMTLLVSNTYVLLFYRLICPLLHLYGSSRLALLFLIVCPLSTVCHFTLCCLVFCNKLSIVKSAHVVTTRNTQCSNASVIECIQRDNARSYRMRTLIKFFPSSLCVPTGPFPARSGLRKFCTHASAIDCTRLSVPYRRPCSLVSRPRPHKYKDLGGKRVW